MSKYLSGLFTNTRGYVSEAVAIELDIRPLESTAEVWKRIDATEKNYPGTCVPRSFNAVTPSGMVHFAPNGTKHIYETLISTKGLTSMKNANPDLLAQFILYDCHKALEAATANGIPERKMAVRSGHWEFVLNQRANDKYPVVYHARFFGLN